MTRLRFFLQQGHYAFTAVVLQSFRFALNVPECGLCVELEMGVMSASQQVDFAKLKKRDTLAFVSSCPISGRCSSKHQFSH